MRQALIDLNFGSSAILRTIDTPTSLSAEGVAFKARDETRIVSLGLSISTENRLARRRAVAMMSLRGLAFGPHFLWRFFLSNSDPLSALDLTALYALAAGCAAQGATYWFANHLMRRLGWIWWAEGLGGAASGLALWWAWAHPSTKPVPRSYPPSVPRSGPAGVK